MVVTPYAQKAMLDFVCGGATPTPISGHWLGLVDVAGTELSINGYSRMSATFPPAASPVAYASMSPMTFGAYSSIAPTMVYGAVLFDGASGANALMSGTLEPRTIPDRGGLVVSQLAISLS